MATDQKIIDRLQQANKDLEEKLALLKGASKTKIVYAPHKLPKYSGDRAGLDDWINDATAAVLAQSLDGKEAANFVMAHLENEAKNEVKYSSQNKATADEIFSILKDSFGEKKTDTELWYRLVFFTDCRAKMKP